MNEAIPSRHGIPRRMSRWAAVLSGLMTGGLLLGALLLAGCSRGAPNHTPVDGGGQTPYQRALAIAQCMRRSGVTSFPGPDSNGTFPASADKDKSNASFQSAVKACQGLPSSGVGNSPF